MTARIHLGRRRVNLALCVVLVCASAVMGYGRAAQAYDAVPGEYLVRFKAGNEQNAMARLAAESGIEVTGAQKFRTIDWYHVTAHGPKGATDEAVLKAIQADPGVVMAEPNYIVSALATVPNDPRLGELWGLNNYGQTGGTADADIDAPEAWDIGVDSTGIVVAVIDSGVDYTHADLAANMWVNAAEQAGSPGVDDDANGYVDDIYGYDFYENDGDPADVLGHGTHVSGTIGAVGNNSLGVVGVSWTAQIMALRFLGPLGFGDTADAVKAVEYATLMGAEISNNSWGGGGYSQALYDAIAAAGAAGSLFVAASGNDGVDVDVAPMYPAAYDLANILSVAATDHVDGLAGFSNYGLVGTDMGAPGVDVLSTMPGGVYDTKSGTSMACPHVAGAAALVWAQAPTLTWDAVKAVIMYGADPIPSLAGLTVTGARLNLFVSLQLAGGSGVTIVSRSPLRSATPGVLYSEQLVAVGGTTPYTWAVIGGAPPPGITLSPTGVLGGTPTVGGVYTFTVRVTDAAVETDEKEFQLAVTTPLLITTAAWLPGAQEGQAYSTTLEADGGATPYAWSVPNGYDETTDTLQWRGGGEPQLWNGDDTDWELDLPWLFPYKGYLYSKITVGVNGYIALGFPASTILALEDLSAGYRAIIPLGLDLVTDGTAQPDEDIYITQTSSYVVVRWQAETYANQVPVDVELILYKNGNIQFNYRELILATQKPICGISGAGTLESTRFNDSPIIPENVSTILTWQRPLPDGLYMDGANGEVYGVPLEDGELDFVVRCDDSSVPMETDDKRFTLAISNGTPGGIAVTDTISPTTDHYMPFGLVPVSPGLSAESVTMTNTGPGYLLVRDIEVADAYFEDFSNPVDSDIGWTMDQDWHGDGARWLNSEGSGELTSKCSFTDNCGMQQDFYMQAYVTKGDGYAIYLVVRADPIFTRKPHCAGSAYAFGIDDGSYYVFKQVNGTFRKYTGWKDSDYINDDEEGNLLAVNADGSRIKFYCNGHLLYTVNDSSLRSGLPGVMCYQSGAVTTNDVTNFEVDNVVITVPMRDNDIDLTAAQEWHNGLADSGGDDPANRGPRAEALNCPFEPSREPELLVAPTVAGSFTVSGDPTTPTSYAPTSSQAFDVIFEPQDIGISVAQLIINTGDENYVTMTLTGTGEETKLTVDHGVETVGTSWRSVYFTENLVDPVVVCGPVTENDTAPVVVRVRNVLPGGFQMRLQEWDYQDGSHANEQVCWMAVERGAWGSVSGTVIADSIDTGNTSVYWPTRVDLTGLAPTDFVVFTQVMTCQGAQAVTDRICGTDATGFDVALQEEESGDGYHATETMGYIVIPQGAFVLDTTEGQSFLSDAIVTHNSTMVTDGLGQAMLRCQEEKSQDTEIAHVAERVACLFFAQSGRPLAEAQTLNGGDPISLRYSELAQEFVEETGVAAIDSHWTTVDLSRSFTSPVVIAGPPTLYGPHPGVVRVRNVQPTSFDIRFQEWGYLDGWHTGELVRWVVGERGVFALGGTDVIAVDVLGTSNTSLVTPTVVDFIVVFDSAPVVVATPQTATGWQTVTERLWTVTSAGFSIALQEAEAQGPHTWETIGYMAKGANATFNSPQGTTNGVAFQDVDNAGGNWDVVIQEEQSLDSETTHAAENVAGIFYDDGLTGPDLVADMYTLNETDTAALRAVPATLGNVAVIAQTGEGAPLLNQVIGINVRDEKLGTALITAREAPTCECAIGSTVQLAAPPSIVTEDGAYAFRHWLVDGTTLDAGADVIDVKVKGEHVAIAVYMLVVAPDDKAADERAQ